MECNHLAKPKHKLANPSLIIEIKSKVSNDILLGIIGYKYVLCTLISDDLKQAQWHMTFDR